MMRRGPVLAVVLPIYGQPSLLIEAIESALRQRTSLDYRLVLVNDGCPLSQTSQICRTYARAYAGRVHYVHKCNGGLASARNRGVATALQLWPGLDAIYFLDADNRIQPCFLDKAYALLQADPEVDWIFPDIHMFGWSRDFVDMAGPFSGLQLLMHNYIEAGSLIRRKVFERGLAFDEGMGPGNQHSDSARGSKRCRALDAQCPPGYEDWDFWLQGIKAGMRGKHGTALGFRYRKRPESMLANSWRDREQIVGYIRRKHANLFTMRQAKLYEDQELPRFALYLADRDEIVLTSNVACAKQRLTCAAFARMLRRWRAAWQLQPCPTTLVVTDSAVFNLLTRRGMAANVLWTLEADLESERLALIAIEQMMGIEVRLKLSKSRPTCRADRNRAVVAAVSRRSLESLWQRHVMDLSALVNAQPGELRGRARDLTIDHVERPVALRADALLHLENLVQRLRQETQPQGPAPLDPRRLPYRPPNDADTIHRTVFQAPPPPPTAMAAGERHIGFVVPLAEFSGVERIVHNIGREAGRLGWKPHLFVVGANQLHLLEEFKDTYASLHLVPDEDMWNASRLISLLGTMHVVVNNHSLQLNTVLGALGRLGVKLVTQLQIIDLTKDGMPCGYPHIAVDYEHSLHRVLVPSTQLMHWLMARGVPREKIILVPNAPSFTVPDSKLKVALDDRQHRTGEHPLRVLFMARFDRQKGLDRLLDLVRASENRQVPLEWRIVGKAVLEDAADSESALTTLEKYLHPPALDAYALMRHYSWADVLILTSRYEGSPLTILEAQLLGCVPLATRTGAIEELIDEGRTGILFANDQDTIQLSYAILDRLEKLHRDRATLRRLAQHASHVRREQTWRHTTREWAACLNAWFPAQGGP